jgi:membrane glycosyltransferase
MNFRLLPARGMHPVHRVVFVTGVMAYLSAPLWFLFLALSTCMLAMHSLVEPQYFVQPRQLFPIWPRWDPEKAIALFSATAVLLFLPKILAGLLACLRAAQQFGGRLRVITGMLLEMLFSMLLAPVRMLFHTWFVAAAFLGWEIRWKSPPREDAETTWLEGVRKHGLHMLLGLAWGAGVYWLNPSFLPWLLPIAGALALSVPISVWSSRVSFGRWLRGMKLFAIPEELQPPPELTATGAYADMPGCTPDFIDAVVDPSLNALVCAAGRPRPALPARTRRERTALVRTALRAGPGVLDDAQRRLLLDDPLAMSQLHLEMRATAFVHPGWTQRLARKNEKGAA